MIWVFVESSAALEFLLDQPRRDDVLACLAAAPGLGASELMILESSRVIARLKGHAAEAAFARLAALELRITLFPIRVDLRAELGRPFPIEPVRTLDALHLGTALMVRRPGESVGFLALDDRVRANAAALGFRVLP